MRILILTALLAAIGLGLAASARAGSCQTYCHDSGNGNQTCETYCN